MDERVANHEGWKDQKVCTQRCFVWRDIFIREFDPCTIS